MQKIHTLRLEQSTVTHELTQALHTFTQINQIVKGRRLT